MKIVISGGSGMVGKRIIKILLEKGHSVVNLTTNTRLAGLSDKELSNVYWDPSRNELDPESIKGADGVINLAGFNVSNPWTDANKTKMTDSRISSTRLLVQRCLKLEKPLKVFVSASASGIYPSSPELQNEHSVLGNDFLATLSRHWEIETSPIDKAGIRKVIIRLGVVLDAKQGAVGKMVPFFKLGLGASIGKGDQWMSWIHLDDLVRLFVFALENESMRGVYNGVSPNPVTNRTFSKTLASVMGKPFFLPSIPTIVLRIMFGEMSTMLTNSQRLDASKTCATGFNFSYPEIKEALAQLFENTK